MARILVVDDERSMRDFLGICLKREGHEVGVAESGERAIEILNQERFDVLITDLRMGGIGGLQLLSEVRTKEIDTEVIVMTAFASAETALSAMKQGAYDYLTKPFKVDEITSVIGRALEKRSLVEANAALRERVSQAYRLDSLVGKSPGMQRVFELVRKVAASKSSVLITGESGTGKELVARAIHNEGSRSEHPFIAVNCGAIPANLIESELFGHEKGAFTGAQGDKIGLVRAAEGGTLFLDEVGELPLELQVKLLRVLQERRVRPVGSSEEHSIDVRILAATNRDLEDEVEEGAFRQDLYYRLNVIELRIPPLRQRPEDIELLANHFLRRLAGEHDKGVHVFSKEAMRRLLEYDYPGNVREMENIVERALTLCDGKEIAKSDLPRMHRRPSSDEGNASTIPPEGVELDRLVADYERRWVKRAMEEAKGVRKQAAALLGVSFRSLRYRLKKLGLDDESDGDAASNDSGSK